MRWGRTCRQRHHDCAEIMMHASSYQPVIRRRFAFLKARNPFIIIIAISEAKIASPRIDLVPKHRRRYLLAPALSPFVLKRREIILPYFIIDMQYDGKSTEA